MKYYSPDVQRLSWALWFFLGGHSRGLEIMLGKFPFPDNDELAMMCAFLFKSPKQKAALAEDLREFGYSVDTSTSGFYMDAAVIISEIIRSSGLNAIIAEFKRACAEKSTDYRIFFDWYLHMNRGRPCHGEAPTTPELMRKYGLSEATLRRRREAFVLASALRIRRGYKEAEALLSVGTRGRPRKTTVGDVTYAKKRSA